jgi:hypothetical protein
MTARKNANAGPRFHEDPNLPPGRQDITQWPIRLTNVPEHPVKHRHSSTTPTALVKKEARAW